jgi:hypothetical protein
MEKETTSGEERNYWAHHKVWQSDENTEEFQFWSNFGVWQVSFLARKRCPYDVGAC